MNLLKPHLFLVVLLILSYSASYSFAQITYGARGSGLNHAITALPENEWAVYGNPAFMPEKGQSSSIYFIRYYGMTELSDMAATTILQTKYGTIGLGIHSYGFEKYRESDFQLAYRYKWNTLTIATRLHYDYISIGGVYGSAGTIGLDLGLGVKLNENTYLGGTIVNLNKPEIGKIAEDRPRWMTLGMSYLVSSKVRILTELIKDVRFPVSPRAGIEIMPLEFVVVRAGAGANPSAFTLGFGFTRSNLMINMSAERHEYLGWSPGIDLTWMW